MMIRYLNHPPISASGANILEMIGKKAELGAYEALSVTKVAADESYADANHYHKRSDELYYVIKGAGSLTVNDTPHLLQEGDCALVERGEQHFIQTVKAPFEFIVICSPAWEEQDTYYV